MENDKLTASPINTEDDYPTVRDHFAMAALQGLLADTWMKCDNLGMDSLCRDAWAFADAMMAARIQAGQTN